MIAPCCLQGRGAARHLDPQLALSEQKPSLSEQTLKTMFDSPFNPWPQKKASKTAPLLGSLTPQIGGEGRGPAPGEGGGGVGGGFGGEGGGGGGGGAGQNRSAAFFFGRQIKVQRAGPDSSSEKPTFPAPLSKGASGVQNASSSH